MVSTLLTEVEGHGEYITHRGKATWGVHYSPRLTDIASTLLTEVKGHGEYITHRGKGTWGVHYSPR